jgi:hypothetical protein
MHQSHWDFTVGLEGLLYAFTLERKPHHVRDTPFHARCW